MLPSDPAYAGQKHYTPGFLRIYDLVVLGIFGPLVWRCPTSRVVAHYDRHIGRRHLDVGPGTGYFIDRAHLPSNVRVLLVDPNSNVLHHAARRLARLSPSVLQADILKPLPLDERFDSVALNYVLHCLPGPMARKAAAIQNAAAVLDTQGTLFGATVLGTPALHTWLSRGLLRDTNRRGIFDNISDTEEVLRQILGVSFEAVDIEVIGSVAVFGAARPRRLCRETDRAGKESPESND
jgi:SAM-dependent methyltransferase